MAGKLHKDYARTLDAGGQPLVPGSKMVKAYAEGYEAQRDGLLQAGNPFGPVVDNVDNNARAWDQGWRDAEAGLPPTHVGGAVGVPALDPEVFEDEPRAVRPRRPSRATDPEDDD